MDNHRDQVYCHQCQNEWYRDEHGLICPQCSSDFTEVIEEGHDPRDERIHLPHDEDSDGSLPDLADHNPWAAPDPEEGDVDRVQWSSTGPNSYAFTGTFYRSLSPRGDANARSPPPAPANPLQELFGNFGTMLQGIIGNHAANLNNNTNNAGGAPGAQQGSDAQRSQEDTAAPPPPPFLRAQGPTITIHTSGGPRLTYTARTSTRLTPRDMNNPSIHDPPVDDLHNVLGQLFMGIHPQPAGPGPGGPNAPNQAHPPENAHPLAHLLATFFNPAAAAHGDAVYTQEALDRVISQLMEQNATGAAPGPASPAAIAALPQVPVTKDMQGESGRAECSICMDEAGLGTMVARLPCGHWFHGGCVGEWLGEHDTCPHCRKGISDAAKGQGQSNNSHSSGGGAGGSGPGGGGGGGGDSAAGWDTWGGSAESGASGYPTLRPESSGRGGSSGGGSSSGGGGGGGLRDSVRNLFGRNHREHN